jgi:hypothetical protein
VFRETGGESGGKTGIVQNMVVFESEGIGVPGGKDTTTRARRIADHKGGGHLRG